VLVAGLVALLVLAGAGGLVAWQVTKDDKPQTTREQFRAAAAAMGAAEAVRLLGASIGGASTDLTVLKGGQATGTVSLGGLKIDVLRIDERTYVKMPAMMLPGGADQGDLANRWITGGAGTTALVDGSVTTPAALSKQTVALGDLQSGYRVAVTSLLPIRDELHERAGRLSPAAQRVLSVAVAQRSLPLLRQSAERDEVRRPVADLAPEGLAVAWAVCAGAPAGSDVADRLRAYGPSDPGDPILFDDRSVLAFVQDLPDLIDGPGLYLAGVAELLFTRNLSDFPGRPYSSGELLEVAAQAFEIELLEREPVTPELIERIREHATVVGEDLAV
jgi:hypothetical protein